jgi:hypothetical protein
MKLARVSQLARAVRAGASAPSRAVSGVAGAMSYSARGVKVRTAEWRGRGMSCRVARVAACVRVRVRVLSVS